MGLTGGRLGSGRCNSVEHYGWHKSVWVPTTTMLLLRPQSGIGVLTGDVEVVKTYRRSLYPHSQLRV